MKVIFNRIVPYFKFLYRKDSPLIAYFLMVNRKLSTKVKDTLEELQNEFINNTYKLCISFLTHKALKRAIEKYANGIPKNLIELIFLEP